MKNYANGYRGPMCGGCEAGFYSKPVGLRVCQRCPTIKATLSDAVLVAITYLGGIVLITITLISYMILRKHGGTLAGGISRSKNL